MNSQSHEQRPSETSTRGSRQQIHPLLRYDPHALDGGIQLIKLEYFEARTTVSPVPRNQDIPKEAFGTLTGRSILVATSHAWFHQCHPDPNGVKLDILRKDLFPRIRKRFPYTKILVFDDWHSCPQWPRLTEEENTRFRKCMDHMNSVYCYCDVVLFIEARLPDLDKTVHTCELVPSQHKWLHFIDTIQYIEGVDKTTTIQKNDIVVKLRNHKKEDLTLQLLQQTSHNTTISFLRRPYGRPNRTPASERGWLYAERITVAIRMAAASLASFDDVVVSNDPDLSRQIYLWSRELRTSAEQEKTNPGSISKQLQRFQSILGKMKFTFPGNDKLVNEIIEDLVKKFETNWKEETKRQNDMAKRAREILLRWGSFSEDYVERAELLCDLKQGKKAWWYLPSLAFIVTIFAPMIAVLPFTVSMEADGVDPSTDEMALVRTSLFVSCLMR